MSTEFTDKMGPLRMEFNEILKNLKQVNEMQKNEIVMLKKQMEIYKNAQAETMAQLRQEWSRQYARVLNEVKTDLLNLSKNINNEDVERLLQKYKAKKVFHAPPRPVAQPGPVSTHATEVSMLFLV